MLASLDSSWQASAFAKFSISSKPAVRGQYIATGTDDPDAKQHFLAIVDGELLLNDITKPPIVAYLPSDQHFADVKWLDSTTLIAATGQGNLKLFQFDAEKKALKHVGQ